MAVVVLASFGLDGFAAGDKQENPKTLPPEIRKAWQVEAQVGWTEVRRIQVPLFAFVFADFRPLDSGDTSGIPVFWFRQKKIDLLSTLNLPDPGTPFALFISETGVTEKDMKEPASPVLARHEGNGRRDQGIGGTAEIENAQPGGTPGDGCLPEGIGHIEKPARTAHEQQERDGRWRRRPPERTAEVQNQSVLDPLGLTRLVL